MLALCLLCMQIWCCHHWDSRESRSAEEILITDKKVQCSLKIFPSKWVAYLQGKEKKKSLLDFPALMEREREQKERQEIMLSLFFFLFSYSFKQHDKLMPPGFEPALCAHLLEQTFTQNLWLLALADCCNSHLFSCLAVPCPVHC